MQAWGLDDWHLTLALATLRLRLCRTQGDGVHWSRCPVAARLGCLGGCAITRVAGVGVSGSTVYLWGTVSGPEFLF